MNHVHHWLIEEARGRVSRGRCRDCGAERDFDNTFAGDRIGEGDFREVNASSWQRKGGRA